MHLQLRKQTLALARVPENACLVDQDTACDNLPQYRKRGDIASRSAADAQVEGRLRALEEQISALQRAVEDMRREVTANMNTLAANMNTLTAHMGILAAQMAQRAQEEPPARRGWCRCAPRWTKRA